MNPINKRIEKIKKELYTTVHILDALKLVWSSGPKLVIANYTLILLLATLPLLTLYLMKLIIDALTDGLALGVLAEALFSQVLILIAGVLSIALVLLVARLISGLIQEYQSQLIVDKVYALLHQKSMRVELDFYESPQTHDTMHRALNEALNKPSTVASSLSQVMHSALSLGAVAILLFTFHWVLIP
ncbi:MAG: hypothetical protein Q9M22_07915, partial [Mariprofundaceae bacterium]|nr:hypothetical protein [Mariprofundaceae bacterium]